jgi:hypothetical protein
LVHTLILSLYLLLNAIPFFCQEKYTLAFSPAVGDSLLYMMNSSVNVKGKDFSGKDVSLGATASGEISLGIKRIVNRVVFAALTTPGIVVNAQTLEGPENYTLVTEDDMAVQATFDQRGTVQRLHNLEALNRDRIWNISFAQILRNSLPALPEKPVAIGDSWKDHEEMSIPFQGLSLKISIERTYVLQNIIPSPNDEVALISVEYEVFLSGSRILGELTGSIEGKGSGQGFFNFYIRRGFIQEYKAEYQTGAELIIRKGESTYREWPFELAVSASLLNLN